MLLLYMGIAVAKNSSVHTGSSSKNGSQAVFHCPTARIASQAGVGAVFFRGAGCTPAAFASSSRMGAPRLHEWIAISEAPLRTKRISSRVAPASRAARMWRRVPSGLRLVQAAFSPTPTSSMNLRGRTPLVQGFVVIFGRTSRPRPGPIRQPGQGGVPGACFLRVARSPRSFRLSSFVVIAGSLSVADDPFPLTRSFPPLSRRPPESSRQRP